MKREMIHDVIGEMIVEGYQPEVVTLNPNETTSYEIIVTNNEFVYITKKGEDQWEAVPKSEMVKVRGLFDGIADVSRFKVKVGKYAGEYIIEDYKVTEELKQKKDYMNLLK